MYTFGKGADGQLGHGTTEDELIAFRPVEALEEHHVIAIACGYFHTMCIVAGSQDVYSWGWGEHFQLGHGDQHSKPVPTRIDALLKMNVKHITAGAYHSMACTEDNRLFVWGTNQYGQLGLVDTEIEPIPVQNTVFNQPVTLVSAGWWHSVAVCGMCILKLI